MEDLRGMHTTLKTSHITTPTPTVLSSIAIDAQAKIQAFLAHQTTTFQPTDSEVRVQRNDSTINGVMIGLLSSFGSAILIALIFFIVYFFRYTSSGRIFLDRIGRPGEYDDEQAYAREEAEALEEMDDLQRTEYLRAKGVFIEAWERHKSKSYANVIMIAFIQANPPDSLPTDISLSQYLAIQEKGVSAWEFEPELEIANIVYFFRYTSSGRIFLDRIGRPGEYDDEQAYAREEAEALEEMDDLQRTEYLRAKGVFIEAWERHKSKSYANVIMIAFIQANPPDSLPTDISLSQYLAIQEKGVSAWEFEPELEIANCFVEGRTEIEFFDSECSTLTNLPIPKQNEVYYWESKIYDKPETTLISIGVATKPYPLFRLPGMGCLFEGWKLKLMTFQGGTSTLLHTHPLDTEDTINLSVDRHMDPNLCKEMLSELDIDLEPAQYSSHATARS